MNTGPIPLRFGIEGIETLIGNTPRTSAAINAASADVWTAAIVGPDGCGKSILALHLASTYWQEADRSPESKAAVIYVSTDLNFGQAETQWSNFGLDFPSLRQAAINAAYENEEVVRPKHSSARELKLKKLDPSGANPNGNANQVAEGFFAVLGDERHESVYFLDLQASTAGDDWGFVNHLMGLLPKIETGTSPKHLLIIDAVEGLETFVGGRDAFGLERDRRSRVAQLVRRATAIGVHVVFIVEEPRAEARLPEQFVTDLVIRLRQQYDGAYAQRTIEVEKCRAVSHVRGQHEFAIRNGKGSHTGVCVNGSRNFHLDDPYIPWVACSHDKVDSSLDDHQNALTLAHVTVVFSTYHWNRDLIKGAIPDCTGRPDFGLLKFDPLIKGNDTRVASPAACKGSLAFLIGDAGTYKGRLGRSFMARAFTGANPGIAILLTTRLLDHATLVEKMRAHAPPAETEGNLDERVLCQRFGARYMSSGAFVSVCDTYIREAQKRLYAILGGSKSQFDTLTEHERRDFSHAIRLVIEDWSSMLATFPSLANDSLLLPSLTSLIRREGVNALIVSTQPGRPGAEFSLTSHELRSLEETQILTWSVPFYGDRRVAITSLSNPNLDRSPVICELKAEGNERLSVNRSFDQYANVDQGIPERVPLVVRLYAGNHLDQDESYARFAKLLKDTFFQIYAGLPGQEVVRLEPCSLYDSLSVYSEVADDSHLDHTLIIQMDEFWLGSWSKFLDLSDYWNAEVSSIANDQGPDSRRTVEEEAGLGLYAPHANWARQSDVITHPTPRVSAKVRVEASAIRQRTTFYRWNFFISPEDGGRENRQQSAGEVAPIYSIPYLWDFGFLLADRDLWSRYKHLQFSAGSTGTIGGIWNALCSTNHYFLKQLDFNSKTGNSAYLLPQSESGSTVSWRDFLAACRTIGEHEHIPAFDVDLSTVETLVCWILEMWGSLDCTRSDRPSAFASLAIRNEAPRFGLGALITEAADSLLCTLVELVLTCPQLRSRDRMVYREHASNKSVASREWYHTASAILRKPDANHLVPLRLPGRFSTRGDWSLAAARGSRSTVLAHKALDLLSSRRNNLLRLQDGIGLPVRDVLLDPSVGEMPTALKVFDNHEKRVVSLSYGDVCRLGCTEELPDFKWLWRSRILDYQRDSFYWRRWISRMIDEQHIWLKPALRQWAQKQLDFGQSLRDYWVRFQSGEKLDAKGDDRTKRSYWEIFEPYKARVDIIASALRGGNPASAQRE